MPPLVIAGGIAAVGAVGGALIGASAQKKAASQANAAQQQATDQQVALGHESLDLQKQLAGQSMGIGTDIYNMNYNLLSPWVARGNVAGDAYSSMLGLPSAPTMTSPMARPGGGTYTANGGLPIGPAAPATPPPNALLTPPPATNPLQQQAQQAIAAGADPAAVHARMAQMSPQPQPVVGGGSREPFNSQYARA